MSVKTLFSDNVSEFRVGFSVNRLASCRLPWDVVEFLIKTYRFSTLEYKSIALVCKGFIHLAQQALFSMVVIGSGRAPQVWMEVFSNFPHLLPCVSSIGVAGEVLYPNEMEKLVYIVSQHHPIRTVAVQHMDFASLPLSNVSTLVGLTGVVEINLAGCCYTDADIVSLFRAAPGLTSIVIGRDRRCFYDGLSSTPEPSTPTRQAYKSLYYRQERGNKTPLVASPSFLHLFRLNAPALRTLRMFVWYDSLVSVDDLFSMVAPTLYTLELLVIHGMFVSIHVL